MAGEGGTGLLMGGHIPQSDRAIIAAAGEGLAAWAERNCAHSAGVAGQRAAGLAAGGHRPQLHRAISGARQQLAAREAKSLGSGASGEEFAVGAERHRKNKAAAGAESVELLVGGQVPHPHHAISAASGQDLAVRAKRHRVDLASMTDERSAGPAAGGHLPQLHHAIGAAGGQDLAVRAER